ncbi:hypothetical protein UFOVP138_61 [uncultured Caudovirales phage]|uniref:Uncharacterized protein n=1 Tax=uncultured Caudovirales phage TaxID=2100421 RepID=A0A6J5LEW6_9CAUD|nr:hypothetical protein UFOVP138_61 [uncultured Caudovirales phage]
MQVKRTSSPERVALQGLANNKHVAKIGFFESARYPDGTPIAYIASIQEYGVESQSIPARPFFRPTIDENRAKWQQDFSKLVKRVSNGKMEEKQAYDAIGLLASGAVAKTIATLTAPPLSKITLLARKYRLAGGKVTGATIGMFAAQVKKNPDIDVSGVSVKPLNDTGMLLAHLTHTVESK